MAFSYNPKHPGKCVAEIVGAMAKDFHIVSPGALFCAACASHWDSGNQGPSVQILIHRPIVRQCLYLYTAMHVCI